MVDMEGRVGLLDQPWRKLGVPKLIGRGLTWLGLSFRRLGQEAEQGHGRGRAGSQAAGTGSGGGSRQREPQMPSSPSAPEL